jgi:hypothetical protein
MAGGPRWGSEAANSLCPLHTDGSDRPARHSFMSGHSGTGSVKFHIRAWVSVFLIKVTSRG